MLVRTNLASCRPVGGHLVAIAGERLFCDEYKYLRRMEVFDEERTQITSIKIISGAVERA